MRLSNSAIQTFKSCPRMFELKYLVGLEPVVKSEVLQRGLSYHEAVENLLSDKPKSAELPPKIKAMAEAFQTYIRPQIGTVAAVEQNFVYTTASGHEVEGRIDAVTTSGMIVEHKTTNQLAEDYLARLEFDEQIPTYMLAQKTNKALFTVCAVSPLKQRCGENEDEFVQRLVDWYGTNTYRKAVTAKVVKTEAELARFADEQDRMISHIANCGLYYRNPNHCYHWGKTCDYAPVCMGYDPCKNYTGLMRREDND